MKFVGTGAVLSESQGPRGEFGVSLREALKAAQDEIERLDAMHANTEKQCAGMLASARAEAANIIADARAKAEKVDARLKQLDKTIGPIAFDILNG